MAEKKFKLSQEEINNIKGREKAIEYLIDLIQRDINMYLYVDIVPRLGLDEKGKYTLSKDREWLEVTENTKIIIPGEKNGKKV